MKKPKFKEGDLLRHRMDPAVLVVLEVLSNNRLRVNLPEPRQPDWEVYAVDCIRLTL